MEPSIEQAVLLRQENKPQQALEILHSLLESEPDNPLVHYQTAWTHDSMGQESDAIGHYEKAVALGLSGEPLRGALLGMGSTYRCLGQYERSLEVLNKAVDEFPDDRALQAFRALTLYNLGRCQASVSALLLMLLDTTDDPQLKAYERALRFYADKLDQTWS